MGYGQSLLRINHDEAVVEGEVREVAYYPPYGRDNVSSVHTPNVLQDGPDIGLTGASKKQSIPEVSLDCLRLACALQYHRSQYTPSRQPVSRQPQGNGRTRVDRAWHPAIIGMQGGATMTRRGQIICEELKKNGVEYIAWIPDSETHFMHYPMLNDPALRVIQVCAEGEAVGICAGMHMGGKRGVVLVENQGAFDSGNVLKWAVGLQFPLVLLIGYLGYRDMEDTPEGKMRRGQREVTEPFLEALGIPYELVDSDKEVSRISDAFSRAERDSKPVALLLTSADDFVPGA